MQKIECLDHGFVRLVDHMGSDLSIAVVFQFEVKAPIFVFRQWHRHRMATINELSARYRELPEEFYVPKPDAIGVQSKDNKQARDRTATMGYNYDKVSAGMMRLAAEGAFRVYRDLLARGVPRELARSVLPLSTYSHMFWKSDLHNLFHFLNLRLHEHAQYEIRVYAEAMLELIRPIVSVAVAAWEANRA